MNADARWMAAAARIAERARPASSPNPAVGCIVLRGGKVIARGWTQCGGRPHAEADALAGLADGEAEGASVYVTLEPCAHRSARGPACAELLAAARPARVVIGVEDPDPRTSGRGCALLREAGIAVEVLDDRHARRSLAGFLMRQQSGRPFVTLKLAMSQDGFIARPPGEEQWITGEAARAHVHAQRARQDAILVGRGTWEADRPRLDVRLAGLEARAPRRLVLTRSAALQGAQTLASPEAIGGIDQVQYLYVEGGAQCAAAFLESRLVDRLDIYRAPVTIGEGLKAPPGLDHASLGARGSQWHLFEQRQLGSDTFTAYHRHEH